MQRKVDKLLTAVCAGNLLSVERLLSLSDIDVNVPGSDGKTALFHAITKNCLDIVAFLKEKGADVNQMNYLSNYRDYSRQLLSCDEAPLVTAARMQRTKIVEYLLLHGALPDAQSHCHVQHSIHTVADRTSLHYACELRDLEMVRILLKYGASPNIGDRQSDMPIHVASRCKKCSLQGDILLSLCKAGSALDSKNKMDCHPLYLAAFYGCSTKVKYLISFGAKIDQSCERESSYGTALHIAAMKDRGRLAALLISEGAQLNILNAAQYTPLQLNINAHSRSEIASLLIYHGATMCGVDKYGFSLMASCINNMRLDCENLARLMVYAGYNLDQDRWLCKDNELQENDNTQKYDIDIPNVSIPPGRVAILCDWLKYMRQTPYFLTDLCRITIRKSLVGHSRGSSFVPLVSCLPLPIALQKYIYLKDLLENPSLYETNMVDRSQ